MNAVISRAVAIFRDSPNASDQEILRKLMVVGVDRVTASRLVEFLPMAYCRLLLADTGVKFCDRFKRKQADGRVSEERALNSEPLWAEALSFAKAEKRDEVNARALLVIAARSSEFDAVNQLANRGSKLNEIVLTAAVFQWPEEGPEL